MKNLKMVIIVTCTDEYYKSDIVESMAKIASGEFQKSITKEEGVEEAIVTFEEIID